MPAETIRCQRCGSRVIVEGSTELDATPDPAGCWAIKDGKIVVAVTFAAGKITGRAPGVERAVLYKAHFGTCAVEAAKRAPLLTKEKAS